MLEISDAIRARLTAAGFTAGAIWYGLAPENQAYPYYIINHIAGGDESFTDVDTRNEIWQVKVVHSSPSSAKSGQNSLKAALHKQESNLTVSGYGVMWCRAELPFFFNEDVGEQTIWHAGHRYRIRIHESTV